MWYTKGMNSVADTFHLQKRGDVWHYYRRVPKHLVQVLGKGFIKRSLGVTSRSEAKRLRAIEDVKTDALFASLERQVSLTKSKPSSDHREISLQMLTEHVRMTVRDLDKKNADRFLTEPPADKDELRELSRNASIELGILTNIDDPRREEWISLAMQRFSGEVGALDLAPEIHDKFYDIVRRGLIELQRRKVDRYSDLHDKQYHDQLFSPQARASVSFRELAKSFVREKEIEFTANEVSQKRLDKIKAIAQTLREIVGDNKLVSEIDDDTIQHVRIILSKVPTNRNKRFREMPLLEAIEQSEKQNGPVLSSLTQSNYLDVLRDMLKMAVRKKFLLVNPASEVRPLKKETLSADKKRLPWTSQQLKGFFEGEFYRRCAVGSAKPYQKSDLAWRFWLPLIMLLTGARPNEIAQLHIADVKQTPKGTWYLDMVEDEGEDVKSLKTESSRRCVPIHAELLKIGFIEFVNSRRLLAPKNGPRLFWELPRNKYGNFAWYAARRLNEHFIPQEIELGPRQALYSLRHNVRDALRRIKAPSETLLAIAGWSPNGKAVSDDYGDPGNPDLHVEWVNGIAYEELDLTFLYDAYKHGS